LKFISKDNIVNNRNYLFRMNIMEEIFEIRSCIEILANDIKIDITDQYYVLQLTRNYKVYILGDLLPLRGKSGLDMYDLF